MSNIAMFRPLCVSTAAFVNTKPVATVGEVVSSLLIFSCCFLTPTHAHPFMYPFIYYFKNINYATVSAGYFFVILVPSNGEKFYIMYS